MQRWGGRRDKRFASVTFVTAAFVTVPAVLHNGHELIGTHKHTTKLGSRCSKKLIESQDEIQEMKRKFKIMNHQIEQLKDEISAKDMALVKEHFDHLRVRIHCTRIPLAYHQMQRTVPPLCQRRVKFIFSTDLCVLRMSHSSDGCCHQINPRL